MKKLTLIILAFSLCNVNGQNVQNAKVSKDWRQMMQDPNGNFYDVQKAANKYFKEHVKEEQERAREIANGKVVKDESEEIGGYEQYKRWESFMEPRVYPSGSLYLPSLTWQNYEAWTNENPSNQKFGNNMIASSTWTAMGPFGAMTGSACGLPRKAGRDNFITFHPSIATTFWVGAPAGGLWKTTNNGVSWTTTTDNLGVIGCSDLAIDPITPTTMYLATGDGDAGDTYAIGVLKSIDGGATWNPTGLNWAVNLQRTIRRLIINPINPQILIAATSAGIWRTTNGGTTWASVSGINAFDCEFKPTNPNIVYATGTTTFYRSTNGGATFALIGAGIPTAGNSRYACAVTTNDTNYVYVLSANAAGGYGGLYRSTVGGTVFTTMSTTPDIIANSCAAPAGGNQGWYDLALNASPLNKNEVIVGGVNHWRSLDGGGTWTIIGCWNAVGAVPPYVHADVHEVEYNTAGTLYSCNDGGVYQYTGTAWTDLSSPMNIAQQYRIGLSGTTPDYWITGHQDNGSNVYNGVTYAAKYCGDGMDCFIDRTNNNNMFCATPQGGFLLSTNAGTTWSSAQTGMAGGAAWVAPWHQDPTTAATLYAGRSQIFKSVNSGANWVQLAATGGAGNIVEFAIAPSNNQIMYVIHNTTLFKTINGGTSWTNVTAGIGGVPVYVSIDPTDPNNAWVTCSGYTAGAKVYMTINGGTTWTNVSSNLPNLPANCIVYEPGTLDRIYVGMDVGVYYKDNAGPNWTLYNASLPNVPISDLEISPANPTKLYAATFGRGTYKVDCVVAAAPVVNFSVAVGAYCTGNNIQLTDLSANGPTTWTWSATPAVGVTITTPNAQSPTINFTNPGTYSVTLNASNIIGAGTPSTQVLIVNATPTITVANNSQTVCAGATVSYTASGATSYTWTAGGGAAAIATYTPALSTTYSVTGTTAGCSSTKTASVTVNIVPLTIANSSQTICIGSTVSYTATGATTYTWTGGGGGAAIATYTPGVNATYSVTGTLGACSTTSVANVTVVSLTVTVANNSQTVCAGSVVTYTAAGATTYAWSGGGGAGVTATYTPVISTVYTVTGTTSGCTQSKTASVTVNPAPSVTATTASSNICVGTSVLLNSSGAITYTWMPGGQTGAAVTYTPAATTIYTCTGTGANGCNGLSMVTVSVSACAGVNQVASNSCAFTIFPNPTSGKLTITLSTNKAVNVNIEVMDAVGKVVMKQNQNYSSSDNSHTINIGHLSDGNYFLRLSSEGNSQIIKIIKD